MRSVVILKNVVFFLDIVLCNVLVFEKSALFSEPVFTKWPVHDVKTSPWVKICSKCKIDKWVLRSLNQIFNFTSKLIFVYHLSLGVQSKTIQCCLKKTIKLPLPFQKKWDRTRGQSGETVTSLCKRWWRSSELCCPEWELLVLCGYRALAFVTGSHWDVV